jgi:small subunit ribosomal protein S16
MSVAVRIRMKKMGRKRRPFYRICAMDARAPRDGKVIEELGFYDPKVKETDARAILNGERISYWLSVGAEPSEKVSVLIKKYGANGTHLDQQKAALERIKLTKPVAPPPRVVPKLKPEEPAAAPPAEEAAETAASEGPGDEAVVAAEPVAAEAAEG